MIEKESHDGKDAEIAGAGLPAPCFRIVVIQRGNRRMRTFFSDADYQAYLTYLIEGMTVSDTAVWAYCLMPNHVHLIVVPEFRQI